jgi:hypothetical protein
MDYRLGIRNAPGNPLRICQLYPSESKIVVLWQSNQFGQDVYKWIPPTSLEAQSIATKEFTERIAADIELRATHRNVREPYAIRYASQVRASFVG